MSVGARAVRHEERENSLQALSLEVTAKRSMGTLAAFTLHYAQTGKDSLANVSLGRLVGALLRRETPTLWLQADCVAKANRHK